MIQEENNELNVFTMYDLPKQIVLAIYRENIQDLQPVNVGYVDRQFYNDNMTEEFSFPLDFKFEGDKTWEELSEEEKDTIFNQLSLPASYSIDTSVRSATQRFGGTEIEIIKDPEGEVITWSGNENGISMLPLRSRVAIKRATAYLIRDWQLGTRPNYENLSGAELTSGTLSQKQQAFIYQGFKGSKFSTDVIRQIEMANLSAYEKDPDLKLNVISGNIIETPVIVPVLTNVKNVQVDSDINYTRDGDEKNQDDLNANLGRDIDINKDDIDEIKESIGPIPNFPDPNAIKDYIDLGDTNTLTSANLHTDSELLKYVDNTTFDSSQEAQDVNINSNIANGKVRDLRLDNLEEQAIGNILLVEKNAAQQVIEGTGAQQVNFQVISEDTFNGFVDPIYTIDTNLDDKTLLTKLAVNMTSDQDNTFGTIKLRRIREGLDLGTFNFNIDVNGTTQTFDLNEIVLKVVSGGELIVGDEILLLIEIDGSDTAVAANVGVIPETQWDIDVQGGAVGLYDTENQVISDPLTESYTIEATSQELNRTQKIKTLELEDKTQLFNSTGDKWEHNGNSIEIQPGDGDHLSNEIFYKTADQTTHHTFLVGGDYKFTLAGGTAAFYYELSMNDNNIKELADPIDQQDAATKIYVDTADTILQEQITTNTTNISTNTSNISTLQDQTQNLDSDGRVVEDPNDNDDIANKKYVDDNAGGGDAIFKTGEVVQETSIADVGTIIDITENFTLGNWTEKQLWRQDFNNPNVNLIKQTFGYRMYGLAWDTLSTEFLYFTSNEFGTGSGRWIHKVRQDDPSVILESWEINYSRTESIYGIVFTPDGTRMFAINHSTSSTSSTHRILELDVNNLSNVLSDEEVPNNISVSEYKWDMDVFDNKLYISAGTSTGSRTDSAAVSEFEITPGIGNGLTTQLSNFYTQDRNPTGIVVIGDDIYITSYTGFLSTRSVNLYKLSNPGSRVQSWTLGTSNTFQGMISVEDLIIARPNNPTDLPTVQYVEQLIGGLASSLGMTQEDMKEIISKSKKEMINKDK